jgi:hypothetical protein
MFNLFEKLSVIVSKQKHIILAILISQISLAGVAQLSNNKLKQVYLKKTNYQISIPKNLKLEPKQGVDYLFYTISQRQSNSEAKFNGGIYLGYFPNTDVEKNYALIDSADRKVLDNTVNFKIYKSDSDYLVQGYAYEKKYKIETQVFFDRQLQFHMFVKTYSRADIDKAIAMFETLAIRK